MRVERMCNRGEYCSFEIAKKLDQWGVDKKKAKEIIEKLKEQRLIDEKRYAEAYCKVRLHSQGWGKRKIRMGLFAKRIPTDIIDNVIEGMDMETYYNAGIDLLKRRIVVTGGDIENRNFRNQLIRYGAGRGFEPEVLMRIIDKNF